MKSSLKTKDNVCVVKIKTESFKRGDAYFKGKSLRVLKRKSKGPILDCFLEDINCTSVDWVMFKIVNFSQVPNGLYQLIIVNEYRDYETGYVEDWNYKLISFSEVL